MTACAQETSAIEGDTPRAQLADRRVPVTVLTGFLGSGKTTLLNRILTEEHGKRIAVIENEFGEIGIDHELVVQTDEEIFEMNNGCICCTVRGDLIRILGRLMKRKHSFDHILIETTGMADPGPVAQTFFMDEEMKEKLRLDAIVTVVDARHVSAHMGESSECDAQLAFADVVLLNKSDLVGAADLADLEQEVRRRNRLARIYVTEHGRIDLDRVLGIRAFDLAAKAQEVPEFLTEELPFEWAGLFDLEPGTYELRLEPGPDPEMDVVFAGPGLERDGAFESCKKQGILLFSSEPGPRGEKLEAGDALHRLPVSAGGVFRLAVSEAGRYALLTQHLPEEFRMVLAGDDGELLSPWGEHRYASPHEHDDTVTSVGLRLGGDLNPQKFESWIVSLLRTRGMDIFRMKGVLSLAGDPRRFVFQGVHMLFDGQYGRNWEQGDERGNQLVFIGRDLDRAALEQGLNACLA